jgi:4-diphosphocytidyl-2-C-methyl-D-erythritol kinase
MDIPQEQNLAYRAGILLRDYSGCGKGAAIRLIKEIPAAAGLGGGSSDGAAVLSALNLLWGLHLPVEELRDLAARLGSDVPFFIDGCMALAEGRGERLSPLPDCGTVPLVLVKPDIGVSTAWAYGIYEPELTKKFIDIKLFCRALQRKDFVSLRQMAHNDLERAVMRNIPVIAGIKRQLLGSGAALAAMSGSGPTVFGVFEKREAAEAAAARFGTHWCTVVETLVAARPDIRQVEGS